MLHRLHHFAYLLRTFSWLADPRWLVAPPELAIDRPIFLLGTQGGGLTLLSRMLRRHPDVISATGNHRYWTGADELQNVFGPVLPADLTGLRYKAPPHAELPPPRSWTYAVRELLPHYRRRATDATPELAMALTNVIRYAAQRHAVDRGRFRFLDKSQTITVRVGLINELLKPSRPRFVLVPRDPYVSVLRAAEGKAADMRRLAARLPLERRIELCAEHYGNSMKAVREDGAAADIDVCLLRFEQLVAEPETSLRRVCDFVELDFRQDMLPAAGQRLPLGSRYLDRWYPIRSDVNDAYERRLDRTTIESVNRHCGSSIEWLGYRRRSFDAADTSLIRAA